MNITEIQIRLTPNCGAQVATASCRYGDLFMRCLRIVKVGNDLTVRQVSSINAGEPVEETAWLTREARDTFEDAILDAYRLEAAAFA